MKDRWPHLFLCLMLAQAAHSVEEYVFAPLRGLPAGAVPQRPHQREPRGRLCDREHAAGLVRRLVLPGLGQAEPAGRRLLGLVLDVPRGRQWRHASARRGVSRRVLSGRGDRAAAPGLRRGAGLRPGWPTHDVRGQVAGALSPEPTTLRVLAPDRLAMRYLFICTLLCILPIPAVAQTTGSLDVGRSPDSQGPEGPGHRRGRTGPGGGAFAAVAETISRHRRPPTEDVGNHPADWSAGHAAAGGPAS